MNQVITTELPLGKRMAGKTSPIQQHVHSTMFLEGEWYVVKETSDPKFLEVFGWFGNSLGSRERKQQGQWVLVTICQEYLA